MAAMARGDRAAVFSLYREFGGHLASVMRREARRLGLERVAPEDLDGMVIDACLALLDRAGAWDPAGGALPWTWADRRLSAIVSGWVGQHADELDAERVDACHRRDRDAPAYESSRDEPELSVLIRLAESHDGCALVYEALERVASPRDRGIVLEVRSQADAGDPSAAVTVGRAHDLSPDAVRQIVRRVRRRLAHLAATEERFAALAGLPIVA